MSFIEKLRKIHKSSLKNKESNECGCIVPDGKIVCDTCGKVVVSRCAVCGEKMGDAWECPNCGTI